MSITLYNQYIYKNGEWKLVGTSIDPPTKTSDLTNDSGFITAADIPVESVNGETGAVVLDAADVGAQPTITANGILKANGSGTVTAATAGTDYQAPLPSQSGNSGKYLTTNGTAMSWGEVDALPSQTGNSGKFLTTDGTDASWTSITQDDHKWGTATLDRTQEGIANDTYVPQFDSTSDTTAKLAIATKTPANYAVAKYDGSAFLHSTTPTSSDNSTKVATTEYVDTAVGAITYPVTSVNTKTGAVNLTASDVGALPDSTTIPQGTVTSVRVQATSPVQSSTNTAQSTTLNTTISLADSYGDTKNPYAAKAKNTVLAGPSTGTATAPSFRTLEADDIPALTVSKISDFPSTMTPSSHTHGNITNAGDITTTATIASGDRIVINDESASKITNSSITFGTSETTYLTNKGTWKTPDYPVTSVNTKTGAVSLTASDVGALPDTTEVPTATSDLTNDSGFITSSDIPVTSVNTKTGAVSLSASDVGALPSTTDVTKWNGVALNKSDAQNNGTVYVPFLDNTTSTTAYITQATSTPTAGRIAKYNGSSYLFSTTPSASDNSTKVATTAYVDSAINELGSLLTFKGVVATTGDLPGSGNDVGDVWVVSEDNSEHVWTGEAWERLGTTVDLSGYVPTSRTVNSKALSTDITLSASDVGAQASITASGILKGNGSGTITAATAGTDYQAPLPSQTSQSGKFLTTNGTTLSWASVTQDDHKWNDVALNKSTYYNSDATYYVPVLASTSATEAKLLYATTTPSSGKLATYDDSSYLHSTTPSTSDNSTKVATTAYVDNAISSVDALPDQTGQSGKYLTTNGTTASWATISSASNNRYIGTINGDGTTTSFTLTHNLDSRDLLTQVYNASTYDAVVVDVQFTTVNTITVTFAEAPTAGTSYKVVCAVQSNGVIAVDSNVTSSSSNPVMSSGIYTAIYSSHSNENLLHNWYWVGGGQNGKLPVNQRGKTSYSANQYGIDRWLCYSAAITIAANGITVPASGVMTQVLEDYASLNGKTLTFSILYSTGLETGTATLDTSGTTLFINDTGHQAYITSAGLVQFYKTSQYTVKAVKLELGDTSTLDKDFEPDYGAELTKCIYSKADPSDIYANTGFGRTNPNLLDNSWFSVNSRGQSSYSTTGFTYDRWRLFSYSGAASIAKTSTGFTLTFGTDGADEVAQMFPLGQLVEGETYTISAMYQDRTIQSATFSFPSGTTLLQADNFRFHIIGNWTGMTFIGILNKDATARTLNFKAFKLEKGTVSTLANDTPPDYGEELTRCIYSKADPTDAYANNGFGRSNKNLLDNAYFVGGGSQLGDGVFPINQRGQTSYSGTYWGLDRWHVEGTSIITLAANGLQFYSTSSSDAAIFTQTLATSVFGETVTCSAIINGTLAQVTYNVPQSGAFDLPATVIDGVYINLYCPLGTWVQLRIYTSNTTPCVIKSAKVEFGTVSTLANDPPPDFGEELRKCMRYLYVMGGGAPYTIFGIGVAETASYIMAAIPLPVPMRAAPEVSVIGSYRLWGGVGYDFVCDGITQSSATQMPMNCPYVGVACSTSSNGLTIGKFYDLQSNNNINTKLIFSAEL